MGRVGFGQHGCCATEFSLLEVAIIKSQSNIKMSYKFLKWFWWSRKLRGLGLRSRGWHCTIIGSTSHANEEGLIHDIPVAERPTIGIMGCSGEGVLNQTSPSSPDRGSKLRANPVLMHSEMSISNHSLTRST
ncbi:hypothetical protein TNCV_3120751 [Trichonephila clavipes]|uniref:Uncharacterized protein n=1 Tax=Trichonephila clavipes TaxID=2585209 RepID=A0A8X7BGY4_TRICX|nr:hypothetical protein TNCV_3120751 [Trichonephila clavipes]